MDIVCIRVVCVRVVCAHKLQYWLQVAANAVQSLGGCSLLIKYKTEEINAYITLLLKTENLLTMSDNPIGMISHFMATKADINMKIQTSSCLPVYLLMF